MEDLDPFDEIHVLAPRTTVLLQPLLTDQTSRLTVCFHMFSHKLFNVLFALMVFLASLCVPGWGGFPGPRIRHVLRSEPSLHRLLLVVMKDFVSFPTSLVQ